MTDTIEALKDAVARGQSPREEAVAKFQYARINPKGFLLYSVLPPSNRWRQMVRKELEAMVLERYRPRDSSNVEPNLAVNHILAACHQLTIWYLDNMDGYSPKEIGEIYGDLVVRSAAEVAFVPREDWLQCFG